MGQIRIHRVVVGPFDTNCIIVEDVATRDAIVVDPGGDADRISERIRLAEVRPVMIVFTHGHVDHCAMASTLASMYDIPIAMHRADLEMYDNMADQIAAFMGPAAAARYRGAAQVVPTVFPADGDTVTVGESTARVIHLPGHSKGGIGLFFDGVPPILVQGDTLFRDGVGRTDLWGGSWDTILSSIRERIFSLPDETQVICGHGGDTTVGREKAGFPY